LSKVIMKSDKLMENINRCKSTIQSLNEMMSGLNNTDEINRFQERLNFMNSQLEENEKQYYELIKNDSPYYGSGTLAYYTDKFNGFNYSKLESSFVTEVIYCVESEHMKNRLDAIKNIVKAYQIRNDEITEEFKKRSIEIDK
jgi:hypothetical protein